MNHFLFILTAVLLGFGVGLWFFDKKGLDHFLRQDPNVPFWFLSIVAILLTIIGLFFHFNVSRTLSYPFAFASLFLLSFAASVDYFVSAAAKRELEHLDAEEKKERTAASALSSSPVAAQSSVDEQIKELLDRNKR